MKLIVWHTIGGMTLWTSTPNKSTDEAIAECVAIRLRGGIPHLIMRTDGKKYEVIRDFRS